MADGVRALVCWSKCWPCQFGECPDGPHTWMDSEDLRHAGVRVPWTRWGWRRLAVKRPCGCDCMQGVRGEPNAEQERALGDVLAAVQRLAEQQLAADPGLVERQRAGLERIRERGRRWRGESS